MSEEKRTKLYCPGHRWCWRNSSEPKYQLGPEPLPFHAICALLGMPQPVLKIVDLRI